MALKIRAVRLAFAVLMILGGVFTVVYFWNIDVKLIGWLYAHRHRSERPSAEAEASPEFALAAE